MDGIYLKKRHWRRTFPKVFNWSTVGIWASGFGLGLFAGAVGALLLMGQLAQWGAR
jgi:hypothetical protein